MIEFRPYTDFLIVIGVKASGKTTMTKYLARQLRRMLAIDPTYQLGDLGYVVHNEQHLTQKFAYFPKVVFQPVHMTDTVYDTVFNIALKFTNYTLVVDEIDKYARPRHYISESLNEIVNRGRAQGIGLIGNTRRPHMIHNDLRSNADHVITFRLHEERDVKYVADWLSVNKSLITNLKDYYSLYFNTHNHSVVLQTPIQYKQ